MKFLKKLFAKGRKCQCGHYMYAEREDYQPMGAWVYYICNACGWKVKEFESK